MHEALYFGPSNQPIFGIYHPATGDSGQVLTVICPPLFNDYPRTHLVLRELAMALAERGQHVLRFDYRGTGDSFGELGEVTVSDWVEDIGLAVQEGRELSGSSIVRLLGVRAGSLLVSKAARVTDGVERLVLWDPVPDGAGYLQVLRRIQKEILERNPYLSRADRRDAMREHAGYRLSERMVEEFRMLDANTYSRIPRGKLSVVRTSSGSAFPVQGVHEDFVPFACDWDTELEDLIVPRPVLERLIACVNQ